MSLDDPPLTRLGRNHPPGNAGLTGRKAVREGFHDAIELFRALQGSTPRYDPGCGREVGSGRDGEFLGEVFGGVYDRDTERNRKVSGKSAR